MINVLRSELIKLRTVRMNAVLAIVAVAFPLIITVLTATLSDLHDVNSRNLVGLVAGTSVITGMLLGVIGAVGIASEFAFGTIRPTFAATPRRSRVIVAKAIVTVAVAILVEATVVVLCFGIGAAVMNSRGGDISLSAAGSAKGGLVGVIIFAAIVSLLGYGLGLLVRSTPVAVALLLLWPLVAEGLIATVLAVARVDHPFKWLPYNAGINLGNPDGAATSESLGRVLGGLYFFAVTAVVAGVGALLTSRRDA